MNDDKGKLLKHFERGNLVFHKGGWGYGEIRDVDSMRGVVSVEFEKTSEDRQLTFEEALRTLEPVDFSYLERYQTEKDNSIYLSAFNEFDDIASDIIEIFKDEKNETGKEKTVLFKQHETPLTQAVIENNTEEVQRLSADKDLVYEPNFLGFNSIEIAKYLDREECLQILEPPPEKTFKVKPKGSSEITHFSKIELEEFFGIHYIPHLKFGNYSLFQEVLKSHSELFHVDLGEEEEITLQTLKSYLGSPEANTIMTRLFKKKILSGYIAPLTIEWIDDEIGYGAFADRDLKEGEYIGEYVGEVRPFPEWSRKDDYTFIYQNAIYPERVIKYFRVDATLESNELHFFNHSYKPSILSISSIDRGLIHATFIAFKDIPKGTQLTWDYGKSFWNKRGAPKEI